MTDAKARPDLAKCLTPLPQRGIYDDGFDWMEERLPGTGWVQVPSWGMLGWDMGEWPYVIVATCKQRVVPEDGSDPFVVYGVGTYVEGDIYWSAYATHEDRIVALDEVAAFYWRLRDREKPPMFPAIGPVLPEHCGAGVWAD